MKITINYIKLSDFNFINSSKSIVTLQFTIKNILKIEILNQHTFKFNYIVEKYMTRVNIYELNYIQNSSIQMH